MAEPRFFDDPGDEAVALDAVGGKAASLARMTRAGLDVPAGAALPAALFEPWLREVTSGDAWAAVIDAAPDDWGARCDAVKARAAELEPTDALRVAVEAIHARLDEPRYAVRSSSPEEDLASASFAGGYETRLGVPPDGLLDAVRACFASCLDARVLRYKQAHGLDPFAPQIAVVVQAQLDSEVAGVAFSINPLTNDYDEVVVDAAWGLGESVVSGAVTPDHFVVDAATGDVITRRLGAKEVALGLADDGGVEEREGDDEACLTDAQLVELTGVVKRIEALFGDPVDVEWAWADGALRVLQARPVTSWVPLPESLRTEPGERRRVYMDLGLAGGLTINAPITPIGESWMARFAGLLIGTFVGRLPFRLGEEDRLWFLTGGRMYQDLSNVLWLGSSELMAKGQDKRDALMAATLRAVDRERYRARSRPAWASLWWVVLYPRALWRMRRLLWNLTFSVLAPERARAALDAEVAAFTDEMRALDESLDPFELIEAKGERVLRHVLEHTMPGLILSIAAVDWTASIVPARHEAKADALSVGLPGNVVVEMGIAMHRMAQTLDEADLADPEALAARLARRALPEAFLEAWDAFVERYGWRGPNEVDLGKPRYQDAPALALRQLRSMRSGFDPEAAYAQSVRRRREAFEALCGELGWLRRTILKRLHRYIEAFGGTRDTPKHDYLMFFAALRARLLREGEALVAAVRLDDAEQVMELRLEDLRAAREDPALDLHARRRDNTAFLEKLDRAVRAFPAVIDSRGRILRPEREADAPGTLTGAPVSRGVATGPVKILRRPDEQPIEPGDVLVAHTTDPGWTPLFVDAAAIVLEVGGTLQHGAVVAREYGKPCVVGVADVLERLTDGERVEVDGGAGVVRRLDVT